MPRVDRSRLRSRALALGLLLAAVALAYLVLVHWWWTAPLLAVEGEIADLREQELRMRMHVRQRPEIEARLAGLRDTEQADPGFLPEASSQLAAAGLMQRLDTIVRDEAPSGCDIINRTPSPATQRGDERYVRVAIQVRLNCGIDDFAAILAALESGRPQLFVDDMTIQARRAYRTARNEAIPRGLDISFDLYGYLRSQTEALDAQ
ncbi:type II secretion system protein GspM [Coralloluteibacterium stylophorae]|uniref:General secretion pathway protein GspM n=1 Tax=Coralloluteibacterium stylophorae TaxID=1776034 RepID=A0A8J7VUB8_9GAMM|nr:type II secretion system protein GspM [Coralloluteibacterium stylophorae]MBS7457774.1 general secretion pathway protein GspM [Coralloluteibacterium stylophorae]